MENQDLRQVVFAQFLIAHARLVHVIDAALADAGVLSLDWYDVLLNLERAPGQRLRLNELADQVLLSRSGLTRLVDRIEAAGLLKRERCLKDRRGAFAILTDAGAAALGKTWPIYRKLIEQHFGQHLSDTDAETLHRVFGRVAPMFNDAAIAVSVKKK